MWFFIAFYLGDWPPRCPEKFWPSDKYSWWPLPWGMSLLYCVPSRQLLQLSWSRVYCFAVLWITSARQQEDSWWTIQISWISDALVKAQNLRVWSDHYSWTDALDAFELAMNENGPKVQELCKKHVFSIWNCTTNSSTGIRWARSSAEELPSTESSIHRASTVPTAAWTTRWYSAAPAWGQRTSTTLKGKDRNTSTSPRQLTQSSRHWFLTIGLGQ